MEYTTIVASPAADSAGFKYIAPYTGSAIGQHWMYNGKHVLIVFDDLSKQQRPIVRFPCCCAARRGVKPTRVMCSTCTPACSNVAPRSPMTWAAVR